MDNLEYIKNIIKEDKNKDTIRNYSIGRNEPCPCGSGKKYKKCCARNNPENSIEDYFAEIKAAKSEKEIKEKLKSAVSDYPEEETFLLPLIVYSLQSGNYQEGVEYLKHAWQLMDTDLDEAFISPLVNLLLDEGNTEKAEKIVRKSLEAKGESIPLLLALGEVYKKEDNIQRVNDIIDRAVQIDEDNTQLIIFRLETLMDMDDIVSALALFNKYYDQLKEYKEMRVIDFLDDFINRRFNLKENRKLKKKNVLEKAVKIFNNFQQIDNLKLKSDSEKVSDLLTEIRELPPLNSQAALDILSRYLAAELYDKFEEYAEDISEFQENNPDFLRMIYLKNYNQGNIEEASKNIKQAFELEKERKDDHFHNWQVASDYLQFLVDNGNGEELKSFIIDFDGLLEQSENLLANLMMLIENEQTKGYQKKLLNRLLDLINEDDFLLISVEDIYNNILFINLAELDGEETFIKKGTNKTTENIEDLIREIESSEIYTPALNYAKLRLMRYNSEFKAEEEKLLQSVKNSEIKSYFDAVAYYESIIRYGDPSIIITEIPYGNYIDDDYLDFYRLTAALKLGYYEIGTEIFHRQVLKKSQEKKLMSYLVRLLRYFEIEELFDHLESMDVREEIYNYLIQLDKMSNN